MGLVFLSDGKVSMHVDYLCMENQSLFAVTFSIDYRDDISILKAFSSKLAAHQYIESSIRQLLKDQFKINNGFWQNDLLYMYEGYDSHLGRNTTYYYEIETVAVENDVELPPIPWIETENKALREENLRLVEKLSHAKGLNAAAVCYLTMYDGGWDYAKEHVIENMHKARQILEDGNKGNAAIDEMFNEWLKHRCTSCKEKK